jgi:hypothetical protein
VNRGLSLQYKGFSQGFIDGAMSLFTLRLRTLSHMETGVSKFETLA